MRCSEVIEKLESLAPRSLAEGWDNPGLLTGRYEKEIHRVMIALDASDEVVEEAVREGADLLLTHHPLIFSSRKQINNGDFIGRRLVKLLQNDVCCYAMHTNFDARGMADAAAERIGLKERSVLEVLCETEGIAEGIGRIGKLDGEKTLKECGRMIKSAFGLESIRIYGDGEKVIKRAAICPGSGRSVIENAVSMGADVLITGDIDHHSGIDALARGLCIIDAGHYGLEKIFVPYMEDFLKRECRTIEVLCAREKNPFWIL